MRHAIRQPPTSRLSEDCNVDCKTIDSVLVRHMSMIWSSQFRRIHISGLCDLAVFAFVFLELFAIFLKEWCFYIRLQLACLVFYIHLKGLSYTFLTLGNDRLPTFIKWTFCKYSEDIRCMVKDSSRPCSSEDELKAVMFELYIFHNLKPP